MAENELFQAVRSNDLDRARQLLLENQVDVNSKNSFGSTALITACRRGNVAFILLLLENGANINLQDSAGYTALFWACQYTDLEVARLLLACGADIDVENHRGKTAYTVASKPVKDEIKQWSGTEGKKKAKPSNEETVQRTQRVPRDKDSITLKSTQLPEAIVSPEHDYSEVSNLPVLSIPGPLSEFSQQAGSESYQDSGLSSVLADSSLTTGTKLTSVGPRDGDQKLAETNDILDEKAEQASEYSDTSNTGSIYTDSMDNLAAELLKRLDFVNLAEDSRGAIVALLPEILQDFAVRLGFNTQDQDQDLRAAMYYIWRQRSKIASRFHRICELDMQPIRSSADDMPLQEKMDLWKLDEDAQIPEESENLPFDFALSNEPNGDTLKSPAQEQKTSKSHGGEYFDSVGKSEAFTWLVGRLQSEARLAKTTPEASFVLRDLVPKQKRPRRGERPESTDVKFELDWEPNLFFEDQKCTVPPSEAIANVITLTGGSIDAQATTTLEYLHQTWPSSGKELLQLIKVVLSQKEMLWHEATLIDGTQLRACIDNCQFLVEATGTTASVSEIGEQLAWLGAALRSSPIPAGVAYCRPVAVVVRETATHGQHSGPSEPSRLIKIGFEMSTIGHSAMDKGQCWHHAFNNPVVVLGYPIPRRSTSNHGLEIPLNIMAGLASTEQIDWFADKMYIKGYSTMMIPTKKHDDMLCWHLLYKEDGSRISYSGHKFTHETQIDNLQVKSLRHILGWCGRVKILAGTVLPKISLLITTPSTKPNHNFIPLQQTGSAQAQYGIESSELEPPRLARHALYGLQVKSSQRIEGTPFIRLARDTPSHESQDLIRRKFKPLKEKYVILWDEEDKRGWLVNGATALLHITRASLHPASKNEGLLLSHNDDRFQEDESLLATNTALEFLLNKNNLALMVYEDTTLLSIVNDVFVVLDQLFEHQKNVFGDWKRGKTKMPRGSLAGWDFTNLVKVASLLEPEFTPVVATLEADGKSWVDWTRALYAVTLVGCGFGKIIEPEGPAHCQAWSELPKGKYYLAAAYADLENKILKRSVHFGVKGKDESIRFVWNAPAGTSGKCPHEQEGASGSGHGEGYEPVQTLLPQNLSHDLLPRRPETTAFEQGAVIFGQHSNSPWTWGNEGDPHQGDRHGLSHRGNSSPLSGASAVISQLDDSTTSSSNTSDSMSASSIPTGNSQFTVTPQNELEQPSSATFFDDVATDGRSVGRYRELKQKYEKAHENLFALMQRNPDLTPVRIAVLDTGLDLNHPTVQASPPTGRRNFLTGDDNVYDQDGHGTFVTGLLMDYAPHAEIFIGKISEGNVVAGTDIIADAIRYAVDEWKVDIISMSFGYPDSWAEEIAALRDALRYAQTKDVLLFAAASNAGSSRVRAFPARSTDVICVLSTCAQGKPSQFSPPAIEGDANLATVGEDVESLMRSDSSGQGLLTCVKSGTSFATPIMAGIAAMLVRYVRILLPENKNDVMNKAVMDKLLIGVAQKGNEHNKSAEYHFVNVYPSKNCILGGLENKYMRYELKKIIL
ncbi:hypothetical protein MCOR07_005526 [Pyricularia oryzae]|nr:hypothetical protein MCOR29_001852 [Pyricularia oryzae]KAI6620304.1 hypothetical protein MCOR07_005526 [Pyricularia oryzae]